MKQLQFTNDVYYLAIGLLIVLSFSLVANFILEQNHTDGYCKSVYGKH